MSDCKESAEVVPDKVSQWRMLMFYIPLAIQALSQSLTYPLVASIVSHGRLGTDELAAFSQGQSLLSLMGAIGIGLITTGMVFARTKSGMANYGSLVMRIAVVVGALQFIVCMPPFNDFFFSRILGLNNELAGIARWTTFLGIPLQFAFFLRNKHVVRLYNEKRSDLANIATLMRVLVTACLSPVFVALGMTGFFWGAVALTLPVFGEAYLSKLFAKPYMDALTDDSGEIAPISKQFRFTIPLSFGGILMSLSAFMIAVFISRAESPETSLAIHYIIMGVITPLGFAAIRMQSVVIAFPPEVYGKRKVATFAVLAGLMLSSCSLFMQIPQVAQWYFGKIQNLPPEHVALAKNAMLLIGLLPLVQSLRGHADGLAALKRRPNAILSGQAVYLATMVLSLQALLSTKALTGYLMGAAAIHLAALMALVTVHAGLVWGEFDDKYGTTSNRVPEANTSSK